jgi:hypothetical protein
MQFRNFYQCARCGQEWTDVWSAQCDDDCGQWPKLGRNILFELQTLLTSVPYQFQLLIGEYATA